MNKCKRIIFSLSRMCTAKACKKEGNRIKITYIGLTLVVILSLLAVVMPASIALAQSISLNPYYGTVGTTVTVTGSDFTVSDEVDIYFPDRNTRVANEETSSTGRFSTTFVIGEHPVGNQTVWVRDLTTLEWESRIFRIEPEMGLDKSSGLVGDEVGVKGTGFAANKEITCGAPKV